MSILAIIELIITVIAAIPKLIDIVKEIIAYIKQRKSGEERELLFARLRDAVKAVREHPLDTPKALLDLRDELRDGSK